MDTCDPTLKEVNVQWDEVNVQWDTVKYNVLKDYHFSFSMEEIKGHRG